MSSPASRPDPGPVRLTIMAPVFPTEDPALVKKAIANIFPDAMFEDGPEDGKAGEVRATGADVSIMRSLLAKARIRNTARGVLIRSISEGRLSFSISKQAAAAGRFTFAIDDVALGSIDVMVECKDPMAFVDELTWMDNESMRAAATERVSMRKAKGKGRSRGTGKVLEKGLVQSIKEDDWDEDIDDDEEEGMDGGKGEGMTGQ